MAGLDGGEPTLIQARWGFIPSWWTELTPPNKTTNARAETAAKKPMWREAWRKQRCLIPASSWYEWFNATNADGPPLKIPHVLERADGKEILFAGLWSLYQASPDSDPMPTCAIITVASAPDIAEIHERTPVVLDPQHWKQWLDPAMTDAKEVQRIVDTGAVEHFRMYPVGTTVSSGRIDSIECMAPSDWPQMKEQGRARYSKEQLRWLRTAPVPEVERELATKLEPEHPVKPTLAEKRLWIRELLDRDDADALGEMIAHIRSFLPIVKKAKAVAAKKPEPPKPQGDLF